MKRNICIIGATSSIAQDIAKLYVASGDNLFLVGRNEQKLKTVATDLQLRSSAAVSYHQCDVTEMNAAQEIFESAKHKLGSIDILLIAHGSLPDQKVCEASPDATFHEFNINCLSVISLLTVFANYFEQQKKGCIAVISSVAGDRGRQSNYVYGAAKGAVSIFLQGLRNRLAKSTVQVLTIKPGFVDTPMTAHYKKGVLWANSQDVAANIVSAIDKKKSILYTPFFWRYIMLIIKSIPERVFCRLSL